MQIVSAAHLETRHRGFPFIDARRAPDVIERQMLRTRRGIHAWKDRVATFDAERQRAQRDVEKRRGDRRHVPLTEHDVGATDPVTARILHVDAVGVLDEAIGGGWICIEQQAARVLPPRE